MHGTTQTSLCHMPNTSVVCRWQVQACHAEVSMPFLRRLNDDHLVPSVKLLERQQETYALMRTAQHDILSTLAEELNIRPQATRVSKDGLTVYNTPDGSLSIALQVCSAAIGFEAVGEVQCDNELEVALKQLPDNSFLIAQTAVCRLALGKELSGLWLQQRRW